MVAKVLEQYSLPSLVKLMASDIGKERWKIICKKAMVAIGRGCLWMIKKKTKKTLKHLSVRGLLIGHKGKVR